MRLKIFSLLLLVGCVHISPHDTAQITPVPTLEGQTQAAYTSGIFQEGEFPEPAWWNMFHDATLALLITKGVENNPSLKMVEARLQAAEAQARKTRGNLFPQLDFDTTENWTHLSKHGFVRDFFPTAPGAFIPHEMNLVDLFFNFSYEFDFWGKNKNLFEAALGEARAQRAECAQAQLILSIQIAKTYFTLQTLFQQQKLIEKKLQTQKSLSSLSSQRQEKGLDSAIPVLNTEDSYEEICHVRLQVEGEITVNQHLLHSLVGLGVEEPLNIEAQPLPSVETLTLPPHLSLDLIARRPDLEAQICRVESAAHKVGVAKAAFYPSINLLAVAGLESLSFGNLFDIGSRVGGVIPALHLPIFEGGKIRQNLKASVAAFNEAVYAYQNLLLQATQEVADAISLVQTRSQDMRVFENQIALQSQLLSLNSLRLDQGLGIAQDVLEQENQLLQEKFATASAHQIYLFSCLDLIRSLGGGYLSLTPHREPSL